MREENRYRFKYAMRELRQVGEDHFTWNGMHFGSEMEAYKVIKYVLLDGIQEEQESSDDILKRERNSKLESLLS